MIQESSAILCTPFRIRPLHFSSINLMTYVRPAYLWRMVIGCCLRRRHRLPIEHREEHQGAIETHVAETLRGETIDPNSQR